ncbi:MAG: hypothetical protein ACSLFM_00150 [Tepidiformaceae bacterium]
MNKLREILGLKTAPSREARSPDAIRRVTRIRETMRWRGFDLTAYSDDEILSVSQRLGEEAVSETGETTEPSREALMAALEERRRSPEPEYVAPSPAISPLARAALTQDPAAALPVSEPGEAASVMDLANDLPSPEPIPSGLSPEGPAQPPTEAAPETGLPSDLPLSDAGADLAARTSLVRLRHVIGLHSWRPLGGPSDSALWCPGCQQVSTGGTLSSRRAGGRIPTPRAGPRVAGAPNDPAPSSRPERLRLPPGLGQRLRAMPLWMKMLAVFVTLQLVGLVASLFRGG